MRRTYPSRSVAGDAARLAGAIGALWGGTGLAGWVLLRSGWGDPILRADRHVATWVAAHHTPWVTSLMRAWTELGTGAVLTPLVIAAGLLVRWRAGTWRPLVLLASTALGLPVLYGSIKHVLARPRPDVAPILATAHGWSYPSGHSTQAAAMAVLVAGLLLARLERAWARRAVVATAAVLAVGVLVSRVELGVHWLTDVLAGAALGGLWSVALLTLAGGQRAFTRKSAAPRK